MWKGGRALAFLALVAWVASTSVAAQELPPHDPRLLDPDKAKTSYSFPLRPGGRELRFKVQLNDASIVAGVSVFREGESGPLQTLPMCGQDLPFQLGKEEDANRELLKHADLNFDGFEDLELLRYYIPHLDKNLYCVYLWDSKSQRFVYSEAISDIGDSVPHPENRTITGHENWQGGDWEDTAYRWAGGKLELIEQDGLYGNPDNPKCGFTFRCGKLVDGKMITTLEKLVCSEEEAEKLPDCPAAASVSNHQRAPQPH